MKERKHAGLAFRSTLLLLAFGLLNSPALAGDEKTPEKKPAGRAPLASTPKQQSYDNDTLIITVKPGSDKKEVADILSEMHATVTETIETSLGQVLVAKTEKGKLADSQKKIEGDSKHFSSVQLNLHARIRATSQRALNDPFLPSQWQLGTINATTVFNDFPSVTPRSTDATLVIMDGGCSSSRSGDAGTKILAGYDATETVNLRGNIDDWNPPHGSEVFNASAAQANNRSFGAGLHSGRVFPIRVYTPKNPELTDVSLIRAFNKIESLTTSGQRCVVNMSFGYDAPNDLNNEKAHPVVTGLMKKLYQSGKVIIFQAAENIPRRDPNPRRDYLNVVAGIKQNRTRASFSGFGPSIQFVAPAEDVFLFSDGKTFATSGNSYSSPLVASIAARVWDERPGLTSAQVKSVLVSSCQRLPLTTEQQGNGLPNARQALKLATGR